MYLVPQLKKLGLSEKEAIVYIALSRLGLVSVIDVQRETKIKRPTIYQILSSLEGRGLVSKIIRNNKNFFISEDIKIIQKKLDNQKEILNSILPEMKSLTSFSFSKNYIKHYDGEENIKMLLSEILDYKQKPAYFWCNYKLLSSLGDLFFSDFIKARVKNKIWIKEITNKNYDSLIYHKSNQEDLRQQCFYEKDFNMDVYLYGSKNILLIDTFANRAIKNENKDLYGFFKYNFDIVWEFLS